MSSTQDWKPIVFTKPVVSPKKPTVTSVTKKVTASPGVPAWKIEQIAESSEDPLAIKKVSSTLRTTIQSQRAKLGLTQKDFAARCNLPKATITAYENGTAIPNSKEMQTMSRVLGVPLSNK